MRDGAAFPIVAMLGDRLQRERTGWRDAKALVKLVAANDWNAAANLADALGIPASASGSNRTQEAIYQEVYGEGLPMPPRPSDECVCGRPAPQATPMSHEHANVTHLRRAGTA